MSPTIRSLEFYSGIGGTHFALKESGIDVEVIAAFDINTTANHIYRHNFPSTNLKQCNIESLTIKFLEDQKANLWTMSPPCQPFTQKGLKKWHDDKRTDSFLALMAKLEVIANPPEYLFLENVVGFEISSVHRAAMDILSKRNYKCQEFILSPDQFGVPNSRPRYYLLASTQSSFPAQPLSKEPPFRSNRQLNKLKDYLESFSNSASFLDRKTLERYGKAIDVVTPSSTRSGCFTKSYGVYITGCGSYLCEQEGLVDGQRLSEEALASADTPAVRKLSPREVANLMCFPKTFEQPADSTDKQMYQTLGNSVNVRVVCRLLCHLLLSVEEE